MPVLDTGSDIHYIARMKLLGFLSPFLIVATTGDTDEDLTTSLVCLMDVPVVAVLSEHASELPVLGLF